MLFDYDDSNLDSIYNYAKRLEGMTFREILNEYNNSIQKFYINPNDKNVPSSLNKGNDTAVIKTTASKGQLGNILEKYYFGYSLNSKQEADFTKVGMELKLTCVDRKKDGSFVAGERLSITNISYKEEVEENFYKSHVWDKIKLILLIQYFRDKSKNNMDFQIMFANKFTPPGDDLNIIINDYHSIIDKIKDGKAHDLSESDTMYLGACTKGDNAEKSKVPQFYGTHIPAKKRNFCLKKQYMDYVLHTYIIKDRKPIESIITNNNISPTYISFEDQIVSLIKQHIGKTDFELCQKFKREYNNNKSQWIDLAYRMLGIRSNQAEEFVKANVVVKAIRIEENGKIKESMSFPTINFKEFATQKFDDSDFCNYFEETKFLFVIFKKSGNHYVLKGAQFWNMPVDDLYGDAQKGWLAIRNKIRNGVTFTIKKNTVYNDLPGSSDNRIMHIRPHTKQSAYKLNNGFTKGNINRDADQLPNGEWMTTQCLWLNNSYILSQLKIK